MKTIALLVIAVSTCISMNAQSSDPQWGLVPYQAYSSSDFDNINLASGLLHFSIPLWSYPQRGGHLRYSYSLQYNSGYFSPTTICDPADPSDCPILLAHLSRTSRRSNYDQYTYAQIKSTSSAGFYLVDDQQGAYLLADSYYLANTPAISLSGAPESRTLFWDFQLVSPDGASHPFAPFTSSSNNVGGTVQPGLTLDGTGYEVSAPGHIIDRTGSAVGVDADGNSLAGSTDTMGRSYQNSYTTTDYTGCTGALSTTTATVVPVPGANGTTSNFKFCYASVAAYIPGASCDASNDVNESIQVLQSVVLPNLQAWTFEYDARGPSDPSNVNFGEVSRVLFPTGGSIAYSYRIGSTCDIIVGQRTLSDGTTSHTWTYTNTGDNGFDDLGNESGTVTDPDGNFTRVDYAQSAGGYPSTTRIYSGTSTLLRRIDTAYTAGVNPLYPIQDGITVNMFPQTETTTLDNGLVSKKVFSYCCNYSFTGWGMFPNANGSMEGGPGGLTETASYGIRSGEADYDYGQGTSGPLIKSTSTQFLWQSNANYLNANLLDTPSTVTVEDGNGNVVSQSSYTYDEPNSVGIASGMTSSQNLGSPGIPGVLGHVTTATHWLSGGSSPTTHTKYYDTGEVASTTDANGNTTSFQYSSSYWAGLPTTITNPLQQAINVTYDLNTGQKASVTDANNQTTNWSFDSYGRLVEVQKPLNIALNARPTTNICYDDVAGECLSDSPLDAILVTQAITPTLSTAAEHRSDGLGRDIGGRLLSDPDGVTYTLKTYDDLGHEFQEWNPSRCPLSSSTTSCTGESTFGITSHYYDALGRETLTVPPDGTTSTNHIQTAYYGNLTTTVDQAGVSHTSTEDALGRLSQVSEDNMGWTTAYQYDVLGNLTCVEQHGGVTGTGCSSSPANDSSSPWRVRRFAYDTLSRLTSSTNPETGSISYTYDPNGNITSKTDARGVTINYSPSDSPIDALNRITKTTFNNGESPLIYSYDSANVTNGIGRRTGMSDPSGNTTWNYDGEGRVTTQVKTISGVTKSYTSTYDLLGSAYQITYPSGSVVQYTSGGAARTTAVADTTNGIQYASGLTYTPSGSLKTATYGAVSGGFVGISIADSYNSRLQPSLLQASTSAQTLLSLGYNFGLGSNDNGNVQGITNYRDSSRNQSFTYDGVNRLASAQSGTWGLQFSYDPWGNLNTTSGIPGTDVVNPMPLPVDRTATNQNLMSSSLVTYGYSANGNMTADGSGATYTFDARNQISSVGSTNYTYDGDGTRVAKSGGPLYWGSLAESASDGTLTSEYVFVGGVRLARRDLPSGAVHYYLSDHLGSSSVVADQNGTIENESDFYPFGGEQVITQNLADQKYKFTGKERDSESGLDYFGARYYGSSMGRFMSPDWSAKAEPVPYAKLANPQSLNLYAYVQNEPTIALDADGHLLSFAEYEHPTEQMGSLGESTEISGNFTHLNNGTWEQSDFYAAGQPAQQPLSSVNVLGRTVGINYGKGLSLADELAASGKIGAAAGLIDANADSLTASEKKAIGQISSFTVAGPGTYLGATGKGSMTLSAGYIEASSAAWVGSLFGHEGQHYLNAGKYSGDNLWRDEQSAGRTQLGIGNKIGFGSSESRYLEQWIDDRNRNAMQQHMQQGYSY